MDTREPKTVQHCGSNKLLKGEPEGERLWCDGLLGHEGRRHWSGNITWVAEYQPPPTRSATSISYLSNGSVLIDCRICGQNLLISKGCSDHRDYRFTFESEHKHEVPKKDLKKFRKETQRVIAGWRARNPGLALLMDDHIAGKHKAVYDGCPICRRVKR